MSRAWHAAALFLVVSAATLGAQAQGVWLEWNNAGLTRRGSTLWLPAARAFNTRVIDPGDTTQPVVLIGSELSVGQILDSLAR
jgi:hypothetical protein